ncbi:hypothetical protein AZ15_0523 [Bordetella bronchiseptica A1-7]|nr:hypothetical protein AZ15_0523 [Bordetella bronchiseptica A1-7]
MMKSSHFHKNQSIKFLCFRHQLNGAPFFYLITYSYSFFQKLPIKAKAIKMSDSAFKARYDVPVLYRILGTAQVQWPVFTNSGKIRQPTDLKLVLPIPPYARIRPISL